MKISDVKTLLTSIAAYNIDQAAAGKGTNTFIVPFLRSQPGVGKTALTRQVASDLGFSYYQAIVAQYDPGELGGLPFVAEDRNSMTRLRPNYLPPEAMDGGAIFNLDELPQAFLASQNICSQMVNEWRVGEHEISPLVTIVATGNKAEHKAGTTAMPSHLKDRLMFIDVDVDLNDFLTYAAGAGIDPRVRVYIKQNPGSLSKFDPAADSCPSPRSWEKVSAILSLKELNGSSLTKHIRSNAIKGQVGEGAGIHFEQWLRAEEKMVPLEEILAKPMEAKVFDNKEADLLYLHLAMLADCITPLNAEPITKYVMRTVNKEFIAYWLGEVVARDKELMKTPEGAKRAVRTNDHFRSVIMKVGNKLV